MSRESIVFVVGIIVVVIPFLGIPRGAKDIAVAICGGLLILVGYSLRRSAYLRSIEKENGERESESFAESMGDVERV